MGNAQPRNQAEPSALNSVNSTQQPHLTTRQIRCLEALWLGPVMRYDLDDLIGCTNSPQVVSELRTKGISIGCEDIPQIDRDGRRCYPGRYYLTNKGRELLRSWGWA
jgi:hypothetical protein